MNFDKVNVFYKYVMVPGDTNQAGDNVLFAMMSLSGYSGNYRGYGTNFDYGSI